MKICINIFFKIFLLLLLFSIPFLSEAQQTDWYDSIQIKQQKKIERKAEIKLKREIQKNDTSLYYSPSVSVGMFNYFKDNPGYCGFEQKFKYNSAFQYDIPFFKTEFQGFHPLSYFASFEVSGSKKRKSGIGACFYNVRTGPSLMSVMNYSYSFKFHFGKFNDLRLGISMEHYRLSLDLENLTFPDMISNQYGFVFNTAQLWPGELNKWCFNINTFSS